MLVFIELWYRTPSKQRHMKRIESWYPLTSMDILLAHRWGFEVDQPFLWAGGCVAAGPPGCFFGGSAGTVDGMGMGDGDGDGWRRWDYLEFFDIFRRSWPSPVNMSGIMMYYAWGSNSYLFLSFKLGNPQNPSAFILSSGWGELRSCGYPFPINNGEARIY